MSKPSPEHVQTVADAIHLSHCGYGADNLDLCCCLDNRLPRWLQYAEAAIAVADATRPNISYEQVSRLKLDVFRMIRDFREDTPGHTSPLASRIVEPVLEAALKVTQ